jgi:uncharacterized lipoprotein YmbA
MQTMKRYLIAAVAVGVLLTACGAPANNAAAPQAPANAAQPAAQGGAKTLSKPVFIDFYAPW